MRNPLHKREARFARHRVLGVALLTRARGASSDAPQTVTRPAW
ncbi:hypothetical protein MFUL124B02_00610 [Myxococcus fulvus 124B02]|nr:hypothetical protein MFUL124B02_00610 [Myxococcus fulvus 124B02]